MISSLIFRTATRYLVPMMLLFATFVFLRGHNEPGGGFVGGLLTAAAFIIYIFAFSIEDARNLFRIDPRSLVGFGLVIAFISAMIGPIFFQTPFMEGIWWDFEIPGVGKLGTPFFFDLGVIFTVVGVTLAIIFTLADQDEFLHRQD